MARVWTIRLEIRFESLRGQVVGKLVAEVMQQEEERRGENGDGRAGRREYEQADARPVARHAVFVGRGVPVAACSARHRRT